MNALVKKEIRLLLPCCLISLVLTFANWLVPANPNGYWEMFRAGFPFLFCPAMVVMLALDSFGVEISSGIFTSLLAQPVPRQQIWRMKSLLLLAAIVIILVAWWISFFLNASVRFLTSDVDVHNIMLGTGLFALVVYSGGLWTVLLLRQVAAAFWFTLIVPAALLTISTFFLQDPSDKTVESVAIIVLTAYSVAGFLFARWLFLRAQDVAWTGGTIALPELKSTLQLFADSGAKRTWRPKAALFGKELQLHSVTLFFACVLLVLHIGVFFLRIYYANSHRNSLAAGVSDFFWTLWLVMPLVIGCTAVAEERKLGMPDGQFCLPVSRRCQFAVKFIPAMIFGTLLGGVMPVLLETVAAHFGAPNGYFRLQSYAYNEFGPGLVWFQISIIALAAGMSAAAFFASTLARSFLQSLGLAIVIATGSGLAASFIGHIWVRQASFLGIIPWPWVLPILIAIPTVAVLYLWLACRNFSRFLESRRLWRDNLLGIMEALAFIAVSSAVIYNRPWEVLEPAEPPHGPAIFSPANPPKLNSEYRNLLVRMPDGRVWFDSLKYSFESQPDLLKDIWYLLIQPLPKSAGPRQFIAGSNWVSATALRVWDVRGTTPSKAVHVFGYLDTVGVKSNGTLWISSESKPKVWTGGEMMQFGDETNWQQVARSYRERFGSFLLLKNDGTLWRWGTNCFDWNGLQTNWPTVRASKPQQIGTNSDWKEVSCNAVDRFARKTDGSVWSVFFNQQTGRDGFERQINLDQVVFQTFSYMDDARMAYVGKNGTLWVRNGHSDENNSWIGTGFLQVGKETNWRAVAVTWTSMVALKSDGSLWKWNLPEKSIGEAIKILPTRLGIHNDWVSLTGALGGAVSLAADGSLWLWPTANYYGALLKDPKQPQFLGNVFGKAD
jgi:ABC-type transport system involved in multi-copper enzyme maturation permease subunit